MGLFYLTQEQQITLYDVMSESGITSVDMDTTKANETMLRFGFALTTIFCYYISILTNNN